MAPVPTMSDSPVSRQAGIKIEETLANAGKRPGKVYAVEGNGTCTGAGEVEGAAVGG